MRFRKQRVRIEASVRTPDQIVPRLHVYDVIAGLTLVELTAGPSDYDHHLVGEARTRFPDTAARRHLRRLRLQFGDAAEITMTAEWRDS